MNDDAVAILPLEREEKAALRETLLVGRRISPQWLKGSVPTLERVMRFDVVSTPAPPCWLDEDKAVSE